jgi:L-aspartate oxidase
MIYDFIIVGSGIAGLYAGLKIPKHKKVLIITKNVPWECNTFYAQGGVSVALNSDDIESYTKDTINAGANYCNKKAVSIMVEQSREVIDDIIKMGFEFDKLENGDLNYTREAAHSEKRILHAGGDSTGRYLHYFLLNKTHHEILINTTVIDLLIEDDISFGVTILDNQTKKRKNIYAKNTILASGGLGELFGHSTNAESISGDIQGIAIEKGIELSDMEMLQFHPTVLVPPRKSINPMLLTEALRGEGAKVVDEENREFLYEYDKRGELASRDIVSRSIIDYKEKTKQNVYLSFENFSEEFFFERFPNLSRVLRNYGFNVPFEKVPISPAFHYAIGGIKTDTNGKVSGFKNLFAIGEVASTGVHGANRLASNSLLEGLVFAKQTVKYISENPQFISFKEFPVNMQKVKRDSDELILKTLQQIIWKNVGIVRSSSRLNKARSEILKLMQQPIGRMVKLSLLTALEIVNSAEQNETSIGVHYRID